MEEPILEEAAAVAMTARASVLRTYAVNAPDCDSAGRRHEVVRLRCRCPIVDVRPNPACSRRTESHYCATSRLSSCALVAQV